MVKEASSTSTSRRPRGDEEMGKAMMGTGESTGEKRALPPRAAIANPLIDDSR